MALSLMLSVAEGAESVVVMVVAAVVISSDESEDEIAASSEPESEAEVVGSESTAMLPSMLAILVMRRKRYGSTWVNGESRPSTLDQNGKTVRACTFLVKGGLFTSGLFSLVYIISL